VAHKPHLIAVSGPIQGRSFPLRGSACSIGRQADRDVQLLDIAVSRCHCEIVRAGDPVEEQWTIRDLDSRYGTFVNGQPVRERALAHGDLIQVVSSSLLFMLRLDPELVSEPVAAQEPASRQLMEQSTIQKRLDENPFLRASSLPELTSDRTTTAAELDALLQLCSNVQKARDTETVAQVVTEYLLAWLPADRCRVLIASAEAGARPEPADLRSALARATAGASAKEEPVSRTVVTRVLADQVALLCTDLAGTPALAAAESLDSVRVQALLCAPLTSRERVMGVIYIESRHAHSLHEHHLDLTMAAAAMASLALDNLRSLDWLRSENRQLRAPGATLQAMVGESPVIKRLHTLIQRVASTSSTVLIRGESGTGKELCARAIHTASARADGPFVAINCATLSDTLLESELFGHEKGAFTGAVARKIGKVEVAHGGTLFLDEIGELPLALQARLLRVLQEREIDRVGGTRPIAVDVRIVAATNRDLETAMRAGKFREDLFYRLNVVTLSVPSLRDRREDILLLARHFARTSAERVGRRVVGISDHARDALVAYDWPGNVRQLGNAIERALVLGTDEMILLEDLPEEVLATRPRLADAEQGTFHDTILAIKRKLIVDAYEFEGDDHQRAAARLGIHANSLHRLIRNLGLKAELGKESD
jgi:transcriptional regulator with GAF, ATPase, and Fis domain